MSATTEHTLPAGRLETSTDTLMPALAAALLGLIIVFGTGFASSDIIHSTTHDVRHSAAFPCH